MVAYDYGIKNNILRKLASRGCRVTVVPAQTAAEQVLELRPDGIFLSNGPGDPEPCDYASRAIQKLLDTEFAIGICLGHQLLALAAGAKTMKMKFGHHGANHPVQDVESGRVLITSQNHGFAVDAATLPASTKVTHVSLFDGSLQGFRFLDRPAFCFQGHPEASPVRTMSIIFSIDSSSCSQPRARSRPATCAPHRLIDGAMPKRTDLHSILIIGAGPIVIGQACEFDYSGAQACKALREEKDRVVLVNSNPATIMTDPEMADATYIEPVTWQMVEKVIEIERPDALLPTMGGQTALNCALDLAKHGVLEKYGVEMIGAKKEAIDKAEDREKFKLAMQRIGLESPRRSALLAGGGATMQAMVGYPTVIRPSLPRSADRVAASPTTKRNSSPSASADWKRCEPTNELLIEESVIGWKETSNGGRARRAGQLHHRLFHREPGRDGRPHGRFDHRRRRRRSRTRNTDHARRHRFAVLRKRLA